MYFERLRPEHLCKRAKIVLSVCETIGLVAAWDVSRISESEYVEIWDEEQPGSQVMRVRFSDHNISDRYRCEWRNCKSSQFEVAYRYGHDEVDGSCYEAIAWVAKTFNRSAYLPEWVLDKIWGTPTIAV
ncbi:MAG: hypothetical protein WDN10_02965 [bacterium]